MRRLEWLLCLALCGCILQTETSSGPNGAPGDTGPAGVSPFTWTDAGMTDIYYDHGNVGIGTATLINGTGGPTAAMGATDRLVVATDLPEFIRLKMSAPVIAGGGAALVFANSEDNDIKAQVTADFRTGMQQFGVYAGGMLAPINIGHATPELTVALGGHVGIGTSEPEYALHVKSEDASAYVAIESTANNPTVELRGTGGNDQNGAGAILWRNTSNPENSILGTIQMIQAVGSDPSDRGGAMRFTTKGYDSAAPPQERMRITSAGNIGVGTPAPSTALHVAGSNSGQQIAIENTGPGLQYIGYLGVDGANVLHVKGGDSVDAMMLDLETGDMTLKGSYACAST